MELGPQSPPEALASFKALLPVFAAALQAVHWAIDELKATVPIWKKEFFEDGSVWKENAESRRLLQQQNLH